MKRIVASVAMMMAAAGAFAQQGAAVKASPDLAGIAHLAIRVTDLAKSSAFYQSLGFEKAFELSHNGVAYEVFIKINDRQYLELYPVSDKDKQVGFLHVCFEGKDLEAAHAYYVEHGLTPNNVRKAGAGNLLFTMPGPATPSGPQNMEYTQYMPGSMHTKDIGNHLGTDRVADEVLSTTLAVNDVAAAEIFYTEKLGFKKDDGQYSIPGGSREAVSFAASAMQGHRAVFALRCTNVRAAAAALKAKAVRFTKGKGKLMVMDPDGNTLVLEKEL